jgi:serine/threonine protein kinase
MPTDTGVTSGPGEDLTLAHPGPPPSREPLPDAAIGRSLGKYRVTGVLGAGGMGVVFRAVDGDLEREVALKVLSPAHHDGGEITRQEGARLLREARAQAQLSHPNVVVIYDVGSEQGEVYLAMELVEGPSLREWLDACRRGWREVLPVFLAAGAGLAAAHAAGLVHRDFKPANVLLGRDGRPRVSDFG